MTHLLSPPDSLRHMHMIKKYDYRSKYLPIQVLCRFSDPSCYQHFSKLSKCCKFYLEIFIRAIYPMGIIRKIDDKLMEFISIQHSTNDKRIVKYRTYISVYAFGVPLAAVSLLRDITTIAAQILILGSFVFGVITAGIALYEWRYFFLLRKKGLNNDKNYFFEESAGKYRKIVFYCCFLLYLP